MNWKKPLATEHDIEGAIPGKVSKLNFGDGLHLRVYKKGYKYFQLRVCLDGKDSTLQLGKHPEMTLAQAQEKAALYRAQVGKVRAQKADLAFRAKLKKQSTKSGGERYGAFKDIDDAACFISDLRTGPSWGTEIGQALVLQLLIPSRWHDIVHAQWVHFDLAQARWTVSQRRAGAGNNGAMRRAIAYLSNQAMAALAGLRRSTYNDQYLFPELASMRKADRSKVVSDIIRKTWPHYPVDPEGLPSFFKAMATQHSLFRSELIEDMTSHKAGPRAGYRMSSYILQRHALAEWWGNELLAPPKQPELKFRLI